MLLAGTLSVIFFVLDIISVTNTLRLGLPNGINPFWKLSSVFKCLMDCVILDDFKVALDRLRAYKISRIGSFSQDTRGHRAQNPGALTRTWEEIESDLRQHTENMSSSGSPFQTTYLSDTIPHMHDIEHAYPRRVHEVTAVSTGSFSQDTGKATVSEINRPGIMMPSRSGSVQERTMEAAHVRSA